MSEYKLIILMRTDLNMRKGKMVAQGGHAVQHAVIEASTRAYKTWSSAGGAKICLGVGSEDDLLDLVGVAEEKGLLTGVIVDEGRTEFNGQRTRTCGFIGPAKGKDIDKITGHLKLL